MFRNKPIIGIAGGIGSGKSFIAQLFGEMGCGVISADDQVRQAYADPVICEQLKQWWGTGVFKEDGTVDRRAIAGRVFENPSQRLALEQLLHPWVARQRDEIMEKMASDSAIVAIVWDTPLLFETGLNKACDVVVFVDSPLESRQNRAGVSRGWDAGEIIRREKLQWPLDKKKNLAHYVIVNTADAATSRSHVRKILSRILAN